MSKDLNLHITITSGYRSFSEQNKLRNNSTSWHNTIGGALDIRTNDKSNEEINKITTYLYNLNFDVLDESKTKSPHIHFSLNPKHRHDILLNGKRYKKELLNGKR